MTCEVCGRESAPWSMTDPAADKKCHRGFVAQAVLDYVDCYRLGYERLRMELAWAGRLPMAKKNRARIESALSGKTP